MKIMWTQCVFWDIIVNMGDADGKVGRIDRIENKSGMKWKQLSEYYEIAYRTIQDQEYGKREMSDYVLRLMEYKLKMEKF